MNGGTIVQYEVDSYILEYVEKDDKYYISFLDSAKKNCRMEITKDIFNAYINSKKAYTKINNEVSRHIEHLYLSDTEIYNRSFHKEKNVEDMVLENIDKEILMKALGNLTETQVRRIELHIINEITIRDVAKLEKVQKRQIEKSLSLGFKKLKKFFEK